MKQYKKILCIILYYVNFSGGNDGGVIENVLAILCFFNGQTNAKKL